MDKRYQVYVLQNQDKRFYIGISEDVNKRLLQHNAGLSKWTAKHRPWHIAWTSETMPIGDARRLENQLKKAKGGNGFYDLTGLERTSSGS